jgi:hypothetical protein
MTRGNAPALLLSTLRSVGGAAFLAPAVGARKLGIQEDAEGAYLVRLFAARNIALTAGLLLSRGQARRLWLKAGIACDALDLAAGLMGLREGKDRRDAVVDTSASALATLLGVAGLLAARPHESED